MTQTKAKTVIERGYCPVLTVKGRDEVRLAAFVSLAGKIVLGPWSKAPPPPPTPASKPPAFDAPARAPAVDDLLDLPGPEDVSADADLDALLAGIEGGDSDLDGGDAGGDDASGGDVDLDALLAGIDADSDAGDDSGGGTGDSELDALLAGFDDSTGEAEADGGEEEMDPELAALLADL